MTAIIIPHPSQENIYLKNINDYKFDFLKIQVDEAVPQEQNTVWALPLLCELNGLSFPGTVLDELTKLEL